jgi:endonuclease IV
MSKVICTFVFLLFPFIGNAEQCRLISLGSNTVGTIQEVQGYFSSSFEHSGFTSCEKPEEQWWVHAPYHSDMLNSEMSKLGGNTMKRAKKRLFLKIKACMSNEGTHGHMGAYTRFLKVLQVLEHHPETGSDCNPSATEEVPQSP